MNLYPDKAQGQTRVCFDLDGILAENTWPEGYIGKPIEAGVALLKDYYERGYEIALYTARPGSHRSRIWRWLHWNNLEDMIYDVVTGKPQAGIYIDDLAYNPTEELTWPDAETQGSTLS